MSSKINITSQALTTSGANRLPGMQYRTGTLGDALADVYNDLDDGIVELEAGVQVTPITFGASDASSASPTTGVSEYVIEHANTTGTTVLTVTAPHKLQLIHMTVITGAATLNNGANTVQLKTGANVITPAVSIRNMAVDTMATPAVCAVAYATITAGGTFTVNMDKANASDVNTVTVYIKAMRVA